MTKCLLPTAICLGLLSQSQGAVLVTNLLPATATYDGGTIATVGGGVPQPALANGHAFNIEFTPALDDLSGTVLLMEIGGTGNGTGLYLIDGVLSYLTKHNSSDAVIPAGLNDSALPAAAVTNTFGPVSEGLPYSAAASWDQQGHLVLAIQSDTGAVGALDQISLTGTFGNWSGDESFSVGQNPRVGAGGPNGSVGGMAGEATGNEFGPPFDVETDFDAPLLKSFAGTITRAIYWNSVGQIGLFPTTTLEALTWVNNGVGAFGLAANWNLNRVPTEEDAPVISNGGTPQIADGNNYSVTNLLLGAGAGASGRLQISNGSLRLTESAETFLGRGAAASGTIEVTAGGTFAKAAGVLRVGNDAGIGMINVTNGNVSLNALQLGGDDITATADGQGTVNLAGGTVIVTNALAVGRDRDRGFLNVFSGTLTNYNLSRGAQDFLTIGGPGGTGVVAIASGIIHNETGIRIANGTVADPAEGVLKLNGGRLITPRIFHPGTGVRLIEWDGGILTALSNNVELIAANPTLTVYIKAGGAVVDTSGNDVDIAATLTADYSSPGGGLTKNGGGTLRMTAANSFEGPTAINAGRLIVRADSYMPGSVTVADAAAFGVVVPSAGYQINFSSLSFNGAGAKTLDLELGTSGSPSPAPIAAGTLTASGTVKINIAGQGFTTGQFPLISYGSLGGTGFAAFSIGTLPVGMSATLVNSGSSIDLIITSVVQNLAWTGTQNGNWDTLSQNWISLNTFAPATYGQAGGIGDRVLFEDNQSPATRTINLAMTATPLAVAVDTASDYTITGPGKIGGATGLTKTGPGFLALATANDYSGGTILNAGDLRLGHNSALGTGTLKVNGGIVSSDSGTGRILSNPAEFNSGFVLGNAANNGVLTLAGNMVVASNLTLTLNSDVVISGTLSNNVADTGLDNIDGPGKLTIAPSGIVDIAELFEQGNASVIVDGGTFINREGYRLYNPVPASTQMLLVTNNGTFIMDHTTGADAGGGNLVIGANVRGGSDPTATNLIEVASGTVMAVTASGGNGRIIFSQANGGAKSAMNIQAGAEVSARRFEGQQADSGRISELNIDGGILRPIADEPDFILNMSAVFIHSGGLTINTGPNSIGIAQPLLAGTGVGGLTKTGPGTLSLGGNNTYTGTTLVSQGTLGGVGTITGPLTVSAPGILSPGNGIGVLTVNNSIELAGTVLAEVNADSGLSDKVTGLTGAAYGGTLIISNVGTTPLEAGMVFDLFDGAPGSGNFANIVLVPDPTLSATFDPATGQVTLTSAGQPTLGYTDLGNGVLRFEWTGPFKLVWQTNPISIGLSDNWVDYPDTSNPVQITNNPSIPTAFFGLAPR